MKMIKCLAMAAVAAFSVLFLTSQGPQVVVAAGEQCGTQAGGALCPVGYCCSQYGYCGTTDAYCGNDCQSQCNGEQCGTQAGGALCPEGLCCSQYGFCGTTDDYCVNGCQSQCTGGGGDSGGGGGGGGDSGGGGGGGGSGGGDNLSNLITKDMFEKMFPKRDDNRCPANGFYKYEDFIEAAKAFEGFGTTGDNETRKREIAAFFGQTSHELMVPTQLSDLLNRHKCGWPTADGGPYAWGYCFVREVGGGDYCVWNAQWPCVSGQQYYGRGPVQLSYNYNYGAAGDALGLPLLANPDLVATNGVISFKTAIWFWMTAQSPKPSCHSVITGSWVPSSADVAAGRVPGFGMTTNIINGGLECGITAPDARVENRIGYYKTFCDMYDITYGDNLDCYNQRPFGNILLNTI